MRLSPSHVEQTGLSQYETHSITSLKKLNNFKTYFRCKTCTTDTKLSKNTLLLAVGEKHSNSRSEFTSSKAAPASKSTQGFLFYFWVSGNYKIRAKETYHGECWNFLH
jgi:hypothetical protein